MAEASLALLLKKQLYVVWFIIYVQKEKPGTQNAGLWTKRAIAKFPPENTFDEFF